MRICTSVFSLSAGLCLSTLLAGCAKGDSAQARGREEPAKAVAVELVREEPIQRSVELVGTLAAEDEVSISAEAEGRVSRVHADLGDRVAAGQVLVELDAEKSQYTLDQQRAALARALAKYGAPDATHLPPIERTPDVQKAEAELEQARQAHERAQELHRRQLLPKQALDDAEAMRRSKQASYDSALQNAKNLRADIDGSDATLKLADRNLRDTSIRAPFDGYVRTRRVSVGQFVKNQTPVMDVVRVDPLKVTGEIPEKQAPWIKVGQVVELHVDAFADRALLGKVARISPSVNTATRAFPFEALVPNADAALKPGTFARVHIKTGQTASVITVPYAALQYRYGVNRVFVVDGDHVSLRELKVGERLGDRVEVLSGIKAGERIVAADVEKLNDGSKVAVGSSSKS
jgi:multidrug efflux pump subunit AcrA (membrane-fusion protein)